MPSHRAQNRVSKTKAGTSSSHNNYKLRPEAKKAIENLIDKMESMGLREMASTFFQVDVKSAKKPATTTGADQSLRGLFARIVNLPPLPPMPAADAAREPRGAVYQPLTLVEPVDFVDLYYIQDEKFLE